MDEWTLRRARRWGSEEVGRFPDREAAEDAARKDIARNGGVGRIECVKLDTRTVYYDIYAEDC